MSECTKWKEGKNTYMQRSENQAITKRKRNRLIKKCVVSETRRN